MVREGQRRDRELLDRRDADVASDVERISQEFSAGFEAVAAIDRPAVSIFGSARTGPADPWYRAAYETGAAFARRGFAVVTGGGPGIMEAANRGANEADGLSVGFGIVLPREQMMNEHCDVAVEFDHFYARKVMFVKSAEGFVVFPGGFGTLDELFEALTLIQTEKVLHFPVVLYGSEHWRPLLDWIDRSLEDAGMVSPEDLHLVSVVDDPDAAADAVIECFERRCAHRVNDPWKADAE